MDTLKVPPTNVAERLERLERDNRRLIWVVVVALAGSMLMMIESTLRSGKGRTIEAEGLVLRDRSGVVRGQLGLDEDGSPSLVLFDERGRSQLRLEASADRSSSLIMYHKGEMRNLLTTAGDGSSALRFMDGDGENVASFFLSSDRSSGLVFDKDSKGFQMMLQPDGTSRICLLGKNRDKTATALLFKPDGTPRLTP